MSGPVPITTTGSNIEATIEEAELGTLFTTTVWWTWTPSTSGEVIIDTIGSTFDTFLIVYTGTSLNTLIEVAADDDSGPDQNSKTLVDLTAGTPIQIQVVGYGNSSGSIALNLSEPPPPPANDDFANRESISGPLPLNVSGSNLDATIEAGEPDSYSWQPQSVWWTWTPDFSGEVVINTLESEHRTTLRVYTGSALDALQLEAQDEYGGGTAGTSWIRLNVVAGIPLAIRVGDQYQYPPGGGAISLNIAVIDALENDNFVDAIDLGTGEQNGAGSNFEATWESDEPWPTSSEFFWYDASVWWKWTAFDDRAITIDTAGTGFFHNLAVYSGTAPADLVELGSTGADGAGGARVNFRSLAGMTYYIAISGIYGDHGYIDFQVGLAPDNDDFAAAFNLSAGPQSTGGTNRYATLEDSEFVPLDAGGASVWWKWTASNSLNTRIDTVGSTFNTILAVYSGSNLESLTEVAADDDSGPQGTSVIEFRPVPGQSYYIAVHGKDGAEGDTQLQVGIGPVNDDFTSATSLGNFASVAVSGTNTIASTELNEPGSLLGQGSVWWKWTAPSTALVVMNTFGSDFDTLLDVFTGTDLSNLTRVRLNQDAADDGTSRVAFFATAGLTYSLRVRGGSSDADGVISLNVQTRSEPASAADYLERGRAHLEEQTEAGLTAADTDFGTALSLQPSSDEARFLKGVTTFARIEQGQPFKDGLAAVGLADSNVFVHDYRFGKDGNGIPTAAPGANFQTAVDWLKNQVRPALDTFKTATLNGIDTNTFATTLSDTETGWRYVKLDGGDIFLLTASAEALDAAVSLLETYNSAASIEDAVSLSNGKNLNLESVLSGAQALLDFTNNDRRSSFTTSFKAANNAYQLASDFARTVRSDPKAQLHLFTVPAIGSVRDTEIRKAGQNASDSLDGPIAWDGETVDLSKTLTTNKTLREFLPTLYKNSGVSATAPDATLDGIVPTSNPVKLDDFLRRNNYLLDLAQYASWLEYFLGHLPSEERSQEADPEGDGYTNFFEFAFGLDPARSSVSHEFLISELKKPPGGSTDYLYITFIRRSPAAGITYIVAVTDDLSTWDRSGAQVEMVGAPASLENGLEEVTVRIPNNTGVTSRKFIRLEAASPL